MPSNLSDLVKWVEDNPIDAAKKIADLEEALMSRQELRLKKLEDQSKEILNKLNELNNKNYDLLR